MTPKEICLEALRSGPRTCIEISCNRPPEYRKEAYVDYRISLRNALLGLEREGLVERQGYSATGVMWKLRTIPDKVYIDIRTCGLTLGQMMSEVDRLIREHPDEEIFMDGDAFAIVGRRRSS